MFWTILAGFIVTVFILGCYSKSKFRTRNYRVSLWHYWMASADTPTHGTCTPPEEVSHNGETQSHNDTPVVEVESEKSAVQENSPTKGATTSGASTEKEENQGAKDTAETLESPQEATKPPDIQMEHDTTTQGEEQPPAPSDSPLGDTNQDNQMDQDATTSHGAEKSPEASVNGNETMNVTETESGAKNDPNEVIQKPEDSKNSSDSGGEWSTVGKSKRTPKKGANKEETGAKKKEGVSPADKGLRMTKVRKQSEWEKFVSSLSKKLQKMMGGYWATEDTERYLDGYPNARNNKKSDLNIQFYQNNIPSSPDGDLVESIHENWFRQYDHLERHHGYIQWLFPIQEQGLNHLAQPLHKHEIDTLKHDSVAMKRLTRSYELMLDFFGMKLVDEGTGKIGRSEKSQKQQYELLDYSFHNYLRITRILKCLGEFQEISHYQAPFCTFVVSEIFENGELTNTLKSCLTYWGKVIKDLEERKKFYSLVDDYVTADVARKGGVVRKELNRYF